TPNQFSEQKSFFIGISPGENRRQRLSRAKAVVNGLQRDLPSRRHQAAFLADQRRGQTLAAGEIVKTVAPFVTNPMAVDRFVDARFEARDPVLIGLDTDVATG